jgi:hypothetical protein
MTRGVSYGNLTGEVEVFQGIECGDGQPLLGPWVLVPSLKTRDLMYLASRPQEGTCSTHLRYPMNQ